MQVNQDTTFQDITVQGVIFQSPNAFKDGDTISGGAVVALNKTLAENLRNNFASTVAEAKEKAAEANGIKVDEVTADHLDMDALREAWTKYIGEYEFNQRRGGTRAPTDPVEREALRIATDKVRAAIKAKGMVLSEVSKEQIQSLAEKLLEKNPAITEEAKRRVEATKDIALDEILDGAST